jgi:excisionase family DNA binding protein
MIIRGVHMADFIPLEEKSSEAQAGGIPRRSPLSASAKFVNTRSAATTNSIEALLSTREASEILKIHPKVLERMAKRGDVPALKVGKFWRYRASSLDAWIESRLKLTRQPCRIETRF